MADIKQAAKWILEGKHVKGSGWRGYIRESSIGHGLVIRFDYGEASEMDWFPSAHDLLAEDWEIAD